MNPILYSAASLLIGGVVVYYAQSRIRIQEAKETTAIHGQAAAASSPIEVLRQQLQVKDGQLTMIQQQQYDFVQAQMARVDAQTKAMLELAAETRAQTDLLKTHREESSARAGRIYEKISDVNERLAGMEGSVKAAAELAQQAVREARARGTA